MSGGLLGKKIYHRNRIVDYGLCEGEQVFIQDTPRDAKIQNETYFIGQTGVVVDAQDRLIKVQFADGRIQDFTPGSGLSTDMTTTFPSYLWNNEEQARSHWDTDREYAALWKKMMAINGSKELRAQPDMRPEFRDICSYFTDDKGRGIPHATDAADLEMLPEIAERLNSLENTLKKPQRENCASLAM